MALERLRPRYWIVALVVALELLVLGLDVLSGPEIAVSIFDSLNHIMSLSELTEAFRHVRASLADDAPFLFDLNTEDGYRDRWRGSFGITSDEEVVVARSSFDADEGVGLMNLTVMTREGDLWRRMNVRLTQRCYSEREVTAALGEAGFNDVAVFDARDVGLDEVGRAFFRCQA